MQTAEPAVSRRKFNREVDGLRAMGPALAARGLWIMKAEFPLVKVAYATVNMKPRMIPFAVQVDFTDYDVLPLAVSFVDPFEDRELMPAEVPTRLRRALPHDPAIPTEIAAQIPSPEAWIYQCYDEAPSVPGFICLPGVRAYHDHPAHTGDPWELHRHTTEGRLLTLLDTIWLYGTNPMDQLGYQVAPMIMQSAVPA